ncbi:myelin regulatory factor-like isoform X3 [Paramuricea clavata]|uniref:Myelin regulatory factor-like isoform X3 n=1 Tax=Paramuricea clavata TaxID=317549 RepID=A0A7D9IR38_PARCT|nr:myelin regulatory factor-like isoform X3 [Paramuricea clavata]
MFLILVFYYSPLQEKQLKRKCHLLSENNENNEMKKVKKNYKPEHGESSSSIKTIKWSDYKSEECHKLFTSSLTEPTNPSIVVACDKGLTFSPAESVFICQKKNHFQISLNLEITSDSQTLVQVEDVYQSVISYKVHLYAIKAESPHKKITMEQSTADRSKRPYSPVSETTSNNMRKKGKLNPDQRYFQLVVDVRAYTKQGNYSICCQISENVIVRASNPGQFENDVALWSKDKSGECVYRMGYVGINTDKPDQCLSVNGNIKLTGQTMTPSDIRLTEHLHQANTRENLENVSNMKLYRYRYNQAYSCHAGLEQSREDLGVLGSEVKTFIPDAVTESADIVLDGKMVKDVLMVKKDRLLMESLGAIQELSKMTKILTSRMIELETKNEILEMISTRYSFEPETAETVDPSKRGINEQ